MPDRCDNGSVGVIVSNEAGQFLLFDRATPPVGAAPPAGHVDGHDSWDAAARAEVAEETGLTVGTIRLITGGWRPNVCRRKPGRAGYGHEWRVYWAYVTGQPLNPSARETRNMRWVPESRLQQLANLTAAYARGRLSAERFAQAPGIEPVWVRWLANAGLILMSPPDLVEIEFLAARRP